jgi:hypothetical protein
LSYTKADVREPIELVPTIPAVEPPPPHRERHINNAPTTTSADDTHPRYDLYDDGENEISAGAGAGTTVTNSVARNPEYLSTADRALAGVTGRAFVSSGGEDTTTGPLREVPPGVTSVYDGSNADLLPESIAVPGRGSPLSYGR